MDATTALDAMGITSWLGIRVATEQPADAWIAEMDTLEVHTNMAGPVHGGVIATLVDAAGGFGAQALTGSSGPTTDLHIRYLDAARAGTTLRATVTLERAGRRAMVVTVRVTDSDERAIALASMNYAVVQPG